VTARAGAPGSGAPATHDDAPPRRRAADAPGVVARTALVGIGANVVLALVKLVAGIVGNSYALVADAAESTFDLFGSFAVWAGVRIAERDANEDYPFGYGKAEALAGSVVALLLLVASVGIAAAAVHEIRTPHFTPAPWTLAVLAVVMISKELVARRVAAVGRRAGSTALEADAMHHRSDVLTSGAAFVGIAIALLGGPGWESADDWAALVAAGVIAWNGVQLLRTGVRELMDRSPPAEVAEAVRAAARAVGDVRDVEKLAVRKAGRGYWVDIHVQADPGMSLHDAHVLSGIVKGAIRAAVPGVQGVLVHMEPFESAERADTRVG
jgi:cation diffusion facilitator family transporter